MSAWDAYCERLWSEARTFALFDRPYDAVCAELDLSGVVYAGSRGPVSLSAPTCSKCGLASCYCWLGAPYVVPRTKVFRIRTKRGAR